MSERTPVKLVYTSYDPAGGVDETLSPIIFIHGLTGSKEMWNDVPQIIADKTKRKAYSVDSRNHGDTEWSDEFDFDINVDDILHFMDTISISKAVLVGHSMGGITSFRTALRKPERVEMIFVEDMFVKKFGQEMMDMILGYATLFRETVLQLPANFPEEEIMGTLLKTLSEKLPGDLLKSLGDPEVMSRIKFPMKRDAEGRLTFKSNMDVIMRALKNGDSLMTEPKGLYEGPAYFIYGTVSPFKVNEDEDNIRKYFSNAEMIGVENADHGIHIQFPEQFIDIVVQKILNH